MNKLVTIFLVLFLGLGIVLAQDLTLNSVDPVNVQIAADTLADGTQAHSRYLVEAGAYYYFDGTLECDFDLVMEGPDNGWIGKDATPPIIFQTPSGEGAARDMINLREGGSTTLKNIMFTGLHGNDANISSFVRNFAGYKMVWDNCVFTDHRDHCTRSTGATEEITITNCIFINGDRRSYSPFGGMPYRLDAPCGQLTFENNTVVNSGRLLGNGGNFFTTKFHEIHNSFLNQQVNGHELHWYEGIQANNIFYNWSFRGQKVTTNDYERYFTTFETYSAVANKLDSLALYQGRNLFYLEPAFTDYWSTTLGDSVFQCLLWNASVDSTILADENFTIGKSYEFDPMFTAHPGNTEKMLEWDFAYWVPSQRPTNTPDWRVTPPVQWEEGTGLPILTWPPAWDLSYSRPYLMTAGTDGLPLGDLNWFPDAKATYLANREQYIAAIKDSMTNAKDVYVPGDPASALITEAMVSVEDLNLPTPNKFYLANNYPNPFNPTTTINFGLPEQSKVTFTVYTILGQKVFELKENRLSAGVHAVEFDASELSSGIYVYQVKAVGASGKNYNSYKKMTLIK